MRQPRSAPTSISFPLELLERLDRVSHELRLPKSTIVREALLVALPAYEEKLERLKAAEAAADAASVPQPQPTPARS